MVKVCDIIRELEAYAPLALQEDYDNAGLQVGYSQAEISAAVVCLDVTEAVVEEAVALGAGLIVAHHPLLFRGVKSVTGNTPAERILIKAICQGIAIYAAHTNLDNVWGGVNFRIAEKLGLTEVRILDEMPGKLLKLVTFVPVKQSETVKNALFEAGAGHIGHYDRCSYSSPGTGTFRGDETSHPFCGRVGEWHSESEERIEVVLPDYLKSRVVAALLQAHPYEEPAFDLIPLSNTWKQAGSGVIGELPGSLDELTFLRQLRTVFHAGSVRYSRLRRKPIRRVALCGGAGAFLAPKAVAAGADVFLTGEIRYHDYFDFEGRILLAELGHYETEQFTKEIFYEIITKKFPNFAVHYTEVETNPINYL